MWASPSAKQLRPVSDPQSDWLACLPLSIPVLSGLASSTTTTSLALTNCFVSLRVGNADWPIAGTAPVWERASHREGQAGTGATVRSPCQQARYQVA